jgi:phosphoribosylaminoimidazole-succinocarboxamide synthase
MPSSKEAITTTDLSAYYKLLARGKVRDLYEIDASTLLFVATDRISAFDVVGFA